MAYVTKRGRELPDLEPPWLEPVPHLGLWAAVRGLADQSSPVIPTLLLVGVVVGAFVHDRASLARSATIGAAVSVLWGVALGIADSSIATFFGGVVFAVANAVAGTALSASVRRMAREAVGTRHTTSS